MQREKEIASLQSPERRKHLLGCKIRSLGLPPANPLSSLALSWLCRSRRHWSSTRGQDWLRKRLQQEVTDGAVWSCENSAGEDVKSLLEKSQQHSLGSVIWRHAACTRSRRWGNRSFHELARMLLAGPWASSSSWLTPCSYFQRKWGTFKIFPRMTKLTCLQTNIR